VSKVCSEPDDDSSVPPDVCHVLGELLGVALARALGEQLGGEVREPLLARRIVHSAGARREPEVHQRAAARSA
jgi:hypothetical protein